VIAFVLAVALALGAPPLLAAGGGTETAAIATGAMRLATSLGAMEGSSFIDRPP